MHAQSLVPRADLTVHRVLCSFSPAPASCTRSTLETERRPSLQRAAPSFCRDVCLSRLHSHRCHQWRVRMHATHRRRGKALWTHAQRTAAARGLTTDLSLCCVMCANSNKLKICVAGGGTHTRTRHSSNARGGSAADRHREDRGSKDLPKSACAVFVFSSAHSPLFSPPCVCVSLCCASSPLSSLSPACSWLHRFPSGQAPESRGTPRQTAHTNIQQQRMNRSQA